MIKSKPSFKFTITLLFCLLITVNIYSQGHSKKGLRFLYIGDSITDGNWGRGDGKPSAERTHWDKNHIFGSGYMYLCAGHYMGHYPEQDYRFYNRGISGNTLFDLENRWQSDVLDLNPDILSILIGINDVNRLINNKTEFTFDEWEKTYRNLLNQAKTHNPDLIIVICTPFVSMTESVVEKDTWNFYYETTKQFAEIAKKIAKDYDAILVPFDKIFKDVSERYPQVQPSYWLWDGIHPTVAGHQLMSDMWIEKVVFE